MRIVAVPERIKLRSYHLGRRSWLHVEAGTVSIHLPAYFGGRPWDLPASALAVASKSGDHDESDDVDGPVFERGLVIPYFFTSGPMTTPNLTLLFERPERLPPVRRFATYNSDLPFSGRATRSADGVLVDGVELRAVDAQDTVSQLMTGGVRRVVDPVEWFAQRRQLIADPLRREAIIKAEGHASRVDRRTGIASGVAVALILGGRVIGDSALGLAAAGTGLVVLVGAGVVAARARRSANRV